MSNIGLTSSTRNLTVIARNVTDGFYYAGFITSGIIPEEGSHRVIFYNIQPQDVPTNHVINIGGAVPWPTLKIGDYVLVGVRCRTSGLECYMPGRVMSIPLDIRHENRFYTVRLYTGRMTTKPRRYIIKIGKEMFDDILRYVANVRYKRLIKYDSEPNLRKRLLDRGQRGFSALRKKRGAKRAVSAENIRLKHQHHHHHYYHHFYDHPDKPWSFPPPSVPTPEISPDNRPHPGPQPWKLPVPVSPQKPKTYTQSVQVPSRTSTPAVPHYNHHPPKPNGRTKPVDRPFRKKPVKCNEEVLARWSDDGWYYFGMVTEVDDGSVKVLDATGHEEWIKQEDILLSEENQNDTIKQYDKVIALHPRYVYSYAPATVLNVCNFGYHVKFYDDTERRLPGSEVYKISPRKYTEVVKYIKDQELKTSGRVLARDDVSGLYRHFVAETPDHQTQQIVLKLPNNRDKNQMAIHVFPQNGRKRKFDRNWKYVIGPLDPSCTMYLPAEIVCRRPLRLMFCNGKKNDHVKLKQCFYISEDYYKNATRYFFANNSNIIKN
ncbi:uncharacterized protein LOC123557586 isoform X2 [Mercenaria mercenaria]|uniref:uncharacterized protein LOC123557586 isoform X2 n=1 Tax=Mercenaria mercenaria TaxID=6596 RepID=UPI00234F3CE8|nr:uncharacterized protein LOC123557586 isoform X2 [Mercenaria mercenaria]